MGFRNPKPFREKFQEGVTFRRPTDPVADGEFVDVGYRWIKTDETPPKEFIWDGLRWVETLPAHPLSPEEGAHTGRLPLRYVSGHTLAEPTHILTAVYAATLARRRRR